MKTLDRNWKSIGTIAHGVVEGIEAKNAMIAEYRERGFDPVYADEDHTIVVSLPMMLANGWRVETVDGRPALTRN